MDDFGHLNAEFLSRRKICATGHLVSMTHGELARLVQSCGGSFVQTPPRGSCLLVVGENGWPSETDGTVSHVFDRARRLKAYGYAIEWIAESEFLDRVGLGRSAGVIRSRHTLSDLSSILGVSSSRLRRWMRAGLIEPSLVQGNYPYFNFRQVAFLKHLHELLSGGASLAKIRRGIEQTQGLLPQGQSLDSVLANVERDGRVLLRLHEHRVDQTGQRYFDFEPADVDRPTLYARAMEDGVDDLCDEALALEEANRLREAAQVYERALMLQPNHPILHFDLGNVQFQLGRRESARASFQRATDLDAGYAMAWHNLGNVHAQQGAHDAAESALRRAIELVPTYADSHFTLAQVLRIQGRHREAAVHEKAYRTYSKAECLFARRASQFRVVAAEN